MILQLTYEGPLSVAWTRSSEALVGVFDILGFRHMMSPAAPRPLQDLAKSVEVFARIVRAIGAEDTAFDSFGKLSSPPPAVMHVSDTFFLYGPTRAQAELVRFLWIAHHLLFYSLIHELPLRAALATGELLVNERDRLILGLALVEAHDLERDQDWAGATLAPSLVGYIEEVGLRDRLHPLLLEYAPPWKKVSPVSRKPTLCVNWVADAPHYLNPEFLDSKFPVVAGVGPERDAALRKIGRCSKST
jgi:hypothetical protein